MDLVKAGCLQVPLRIFLCKWDKALSRCCWRDVALSVTNFQLSFSSSRGSASQPCPLGYLWWFITAQRLMAADPTWSRESPSQTSIWRLCSARYRRNQRCSPGRRKAGSTMYFSCKPGGPARHHTVTDMALGLVGSINVHLMQLTLCVLLQTLDVLNVFHDVQTSRGLL